MSIRQFYDSGPWISFESGYRSVGAEWCDRACGSPVGGGRNLALEIVMATTTLNPYGSLNNRSVVQRCRIFPNQPERCVSIALYPCPLMVCLEQWTTFSDNLFSLQIRCANWSLF